mmetsp:Transcript_13926/g.15301  ORF Transcript_13926/g.15301 Transcript_13926/m.15301 type:complete len:378 (-) Transcript_13926:263-1396(-)
MNCGPSPLLYGNRIGSREDDFVGASEQETKDESMLASQQTIFQRIQSLEADLKVQIEKMNMSSSTIITNQNASEFQQRLDSESSLPLNQTCETTLSTATINDINEHSVPNVVDNLKSCSNRIISTASPLQYDEDPSQTIRKRSFDHLSPTSTSLYDNYDPSGAPVVSEHRRAKRRRSTLNFLQYLFDHGDQNDTQTLQHHEERDQTAPLEDQFNSTGNVSTYAAAFQSTADDYHQVGHEELRTQDHHHDHHFSSVDFEPLDCPCHEVQETVCDFRARLAYLQSSIEQSLITQRNLTNWDRSMGLKKSHSKTMRSTRKSRVKVKRFLKRTLQKLSHHEAKALEAPCGEERTEAGAAGSTNPTAMQIQPKMHSQGPKAA